MHEDSAGTIRCLEWIPNIKELYLIGDFNDWNRSSHAFSKLEYGRWELILDVHSSRPKAGSKVKLSIITENGERIERLSPWTTYAIQNPESKLYEQVFYPVERLVSKDTPYKRLGIPSSLFIYEVHIGIASPEPKICSYVEFREKVLPRIAALGYNCIQFMAIQEHAYYGSFGYQVTSFFAASSRFGTPQEFKALIDAAHALGITCILDIIHSHASKNTLDGLNMLNGRDDCYFHAGAKGIHALWDSRCFNYGDVETLRLLLSNVRYWLDVFQLDGFRFDGITSMLYFHHGIGYSFTGNYEEYFSGSNVDIDAVVYLMLMNHLCDSFDHENGSCRQASPHFGSSILRIAEDVSGMPTLCRPLEEGGIGFHYRLALAIPDLYIKLLKHYADEAWPIGHLVHVLSDRRYKEPCISYTECHDQALVGDKSIAFWLMDAEMYTGMTKLAPLTPSIDRGLALHKMLRLLTAGLGGEAYLNFMGNEYGHPEWLDFPRHGNNESYWYARRQHNLADDALLRYSGLLKFDKDMIRLLARHDFYGNKDDYGFVLVKHELDKVIAFVRHELLFIFNFHACQSFEHYQIPIIPYLFKSKKQKMTAMTLLFTSDDVAYEGHARMIKNFKYPVSNYNDQLAIKIYLPSRTAIILEPRTG